MLVGCIYFQLSDQKYYLKVKKVTWSLIFLQNLIDFDHDIKCMYNKLTEKLFINPEFMESMHQDLVNISGH